jgi:hypothetical protein
MRLLLFMFLTRFDMQHTHSVHLFAARGGSAQGSLTQQLSNPGWQVYCAVLRSGLSFV